MDKIEEVKLSFCISICKRNLLDVTNAISMPEKKAENNKVSKIKNMVVLLIISHEYKKTCFMELY